MPTLILDGAGFSLEGDSYDMNAQMESAQKAAIGKTAAALIRAGMSVGLDGGTTTLQVARSLGTRIGLLSSGTIHVITSSANVVHELARFPNLNKANYEGRLIVSFLGGDLSLPGGHSDTSGCGELPAKLDVSFVGANGVDAGGFYLPAPRLLQSKRILIENSAKVYIVADTEQSLAESFPLHLPHGIPNIYLILNRPRDRAQNAILRTLPQSQVIVSMPKSPPDLPLT